MRIRSRRAYHLHIPYVDMKTRNLWPRRRVACFFPSFGRGALVGQIPSEEECGKLDKWSKGIGLETVKVEAIVPREKWSLQFQT